MNAHLLAELSAIPVPMQGPGHPSAACVVLTEAGWQLAWLIGLRKEPFGPIFPSAREASKASIALNLRGRS